MKKYIFTILLFLTTCSATNASIEGRMFLELTPDPNNKSIVIISLQKVFQKNISSKNIKNAFLHLHTPNDHILIKDLELDKEYALEKENNFFDIADIVKNNIETKNSNLTLEISSDFCTQNCKADQYPYVKILYSFNQPPTINLTKPQDNSLEQHSNIILQWEGKDNDGRFLEYMIQVSENRFFQDMVVESNWITQKQYGISLQESVYFWRVVARDNSSLKNVVISEVFSFERGTAQGEIPTKPNILSPTNNSKTNSKEILLVAKTDENVQNFILLNNVITKETSLSEISLTLNLQKEGANTIKIISQKGIYSSESSVTIFANWTPPSTPDFDSKIEDGKLFVKIKNEDYEKGYIYIENNLVKEITKDSDWIEVGEEIGEDTVIGIMLEDEVGNQTNILDKTLSPNEKVLGIGGADHNMASVKIPNPSLCRYKYNRTQKKFTGRWCNITKPVITQITNTTNDQKTFNTTILGVYNPDLVVLIDEYQCTWKIGCREKYVKTTRINLSPYTTVMVYINNSFTKINEFKKTNKNFFTSYIVSNNNLAGKKTNVKYHLSLAFRFDGHWIDINFNSAFSNTETIPKVTVLPNNTKNKIFRFPFNKNIGVTQWHGYTAYQSPHTGIDFGSYREPLLTIADGIIKEAKWDNYSGKCLTGGYFVRIEHKNGMNSVYLHLENYKKSNGKNWKVGEKIKKGELIGKTGNSGYYNCQPLGYHLHFEVRKDSKQANNLNPVPYIDVNWDNIPTLQHTKYPGRLTGNNPHPKY